MMAVTHLALGMIAGLLIVAPHLNTDKTLITVYSGFWALVPDASKLIEPLTALHESLLANLFWFHGIIDALETGHPHIEGAVALVSLLAVTVITQLTKRNTYNSSGPTQ